MSLNTSACELGVICLSSKLHLEALNNFPWVLPSCVCVFRFSSFHITSFNFSPIMVYLCILILVFLYFFWLLHVLILNFVICTITIVGGIFLVALDLAFDGVDTSIIYLLMGTHIAPIGHMPLLRWFFTPLHFQWCHHRPRIHLLMLSHRINFGIYFPCMWLGYLCFTKN